MIWNSTVLFLHVPKTGGMSITQRLLEELPRPVFDSVPDGQEAGHESSDVTVVVGRRHEDLSQATELLGRHHRRLQDFGCLLTAIRHPYAMEVSRYFFLRRGGPESRGPAMELAKAGSFERFAVESRYFGRQWPNLQRYYTRDGERPPNLRLLRCENLDQDFAAAMIEAGMPELGRPLRRLNETEHDDYRRYLTPVAERAIYERYRWYFDEGLYARECMG